MSSAYTPTNLGQINAAGSDVALFKDKWSQEIIEMFKQRNVMMPLHRVRTTTGSKSVSFPVFGTAVAAYHVSGAELNGQAVKQNELTILADRKMTADVFVDQWDEIVNHFDARQPLTNALVEALSVKTDKNLCQLVGMAARASATITTVGNGGSALTYANARTIGADLGAAIYEAAQKLDEKDVPEADRFCLVRPAQYNLLVQSINLINENWGGAGSYSDGTITKIAGVRIIKTNHLPITDLSASVTGEENDYTANFANTAALVFQREAIGTVKWRDITLETETSVRHQGTLVVAKQVIGSGILRPECAVEIKIA
jgi:hypothetical protein